MDNSQARIVVFEALIKNDEINHNSKIKLIERGIPLEYSKKFFNLLIKEGKSTEVMQVANILKPLDSEFVDLGLLKYFDRCMKEKWYDAAFNAINLVDKKPQDKLNELFDSCINKGMVKTVQQVAELLSRKITQEKWLMMFNAYVKQNEKSMAIEIVKICGNDFVEIPEVKKALNNILSNYIANGHLSSAKETAEVIGRSLTQEELETILSEQVSSGHLSSAKETVEVIGRSLTQEELLDLFKHYIYEHNHDNPGYIWYGTDFGSAMEVAELMGKNLGQKRFQDLLDCLTTLDLSSSLIDTKWDILDRIIKIAEFV